MQKPSANSLVFQLGGVGFSCQPVASFPALNPLRALAAGRLRWLAMPALLFTGAVVAGEGIELSNGVVASGGHAVTDTSGRFRLIGTTGEPVQGVVHAGRYRLTGGFPATIGRRSASGACAIFCNGFEEPAMPRAADTGDLPQDSTRPTP